MKRKAEVILSSKDGRRNIAIDQDNHESIMKFLKEKNLAKKFKMICDIIIRNISYTSDLYGKEEIDKSCKGITAMKFKGHQNARIYCKELISEDKILIVVVSELLEKKKNQKNQFAERRLIKKVAGYEYEIE
ncbi:MAG: hypothetical protein QM211_06385 [Bacillota bacterium]|jgi:hypothetical protein|nr:hypothetical protein [Bacillota bacterium]